MAAAQGRFRVEAQAVRRHSVFLAWLPGPLAVVLGSAAHLVSGGIVPAPAILLALTVLLGLSASMLARVKVPGWAVLLLSGLAQQILHLAFSALSGATGGTSTGHGHDPAAVPALELPPDGPPAPDLHLMVHAHVAAALLTALAVLQWDIVLARIRSARGRTAVPSASDTSAGDKDPSP